MDLGQAVGLIGVPLLFAAGAAVIAVRFRATAFGMLGAVGLATVAVSQWLGPRYAVEHSNDGARLAANIMQFVGWSLLLAGFVRHRMPKLAVVATAGPSTARKERFIAVIAGGFLAPLVAFAIVLPGVGRANPIGGGGIALMLLITVGGPLAAVIALAVLLHRMWSTLRPLGAGMDPNLAVWGHLVPVLHIGLSFWAWCGWAIAYRRITANMTAAPRIPIGLPATIWSTITAILLIASFRLTQPEEAQATLLYGALSLALGQLALIALGLTVVFVSIVCDALNALSHTSAEVPS